MINLTVSYGGGEGLALGCILNQPDQANIAFVNSSNVTRVAPAWGYGDEGRSIFMTGRRPQTFINGRVNERDGIAFDLSGLTMLDRLKQLLSSGTVTQPQSGVIQTAQSNRVSHVRLAKSGAYVEEITETVASAYTHVYFAKSPTNLSGGVYLLEEVGLHLNPLFSRGGRIRTVHIGPPSAWARSFLTRQPPLGSAVADERFTPMLQYFQEKASYSFEELVKKWEQQQRHSSENLAMSLEEHGRVALSKRLVVWVAFLTPVIYAVYSLARARRFPVR